MNLATPSGFTWNRFKSRNSNGPRIFWTDLVLVVTVRFQIRAFYKVIVAGWDGTSEATFSASHRTGQQLLPFPVTVSNSQTHRRQSEVFQFWLRSRNRIWYNWRLLSWPRDPRKALGQPFWPKRNCSCLIRPLCPSLPGSSHESRTDIVVLVECLCRSSNCEKPYWWPSRNRRNE